MTDVTGAVIDVGALQGSVAQLSGLRDSLTDAQGNLVRMRDVLARLDEERAVDPGGGGLDNRFDDLRGQLEAQVADPAHHRRRRNSAPPPTSGRPSCAPT